MHMDGSDFQTLGAASILVKRVAGCQESPEAQWNGYRIFQLAGKGTLYAWEAIDQMCDCLGKRHFQYMLCAEPPDRSAGEGNHGPGGVPASQTGKGSCPVPGIQHI